jgi:hypothetical protein
VLREASDADQRPAVANLITTLTATAPDQRPDSRVGLACGDRSSRDGVAAAAAIGR